MKKSLSLTIALCGTALSYPVFAGSNKDLDVIIACPAPNSLWVAFPFENRVQLEPHGISGKNTGQLRWWTPSQNAVPTEECAYGLAEDEKILLTPE